MSCQQCLNRNNNQSSFQYPCPCDAFVHPLPLQIGAALSKLPRQIATFSAFRRAMLKSLHEQEVEFIDPSNVLISTKPLSDWRARDEDDLGVMLIEMWAYICDSLSFYDEVIANESYIRTSVLRPNLRKLIALLGYIPRPAVGSMIELAAIAEGRIPVTLPVGTAFKSGAFEGNPPQVFELTTETVIHPFTNQFQILTPHSGKILNDYPTSLMVQPKGELKEDFLLLLIDRNNDQQNSCLKIKAYEKYTGIDKQQYHQLIFTSATKLKVNTKINKLQLLKPTLNSPLWTLNDKSNSLIGNQIVLSVKTTQIKSGDYIMMVRNNDKRWFKVTEVSDTLRASVPSSTMTINGNQFNIPSIQTAVTQLNLDESVNSSLRKNINAPDWSTSNLNTITIHYGMDTIALVVDEPNIILTSKDNLLIGGLIEKPLNNYSSSKFLLKDKNNLGAGIGGKIDYEKKELILDQASGWDTELTPSVTAYGNVITASRGESVINEKMGSGNASLANQTFKLKKKPLSYYLSPSEDNDQGVKNTLTVHVNGIQWTEVKNFYGKNENDQIYIVRQNDEGESLVTFGDGIRGQRLPSGTDNIIGNYRYGAEAACPPAGSVSQISKSAKGLQSVKNMLPAYGGADAETDENLKTYAPKSALLLGRVVSLKDMEALASGFPGVRGVQTAWRWDSNKQRATAHIYYIGDAGLKTLLSQKIRSVSDPSTPITIETALAIPFELSLNVQINAKYFEADVIIALQTALLDTVYGILAPENIGIGLPLFRSNLFNEILKVEGTETVKSILVNNANFDEYAITPGTGSYFNIELGKLIINGIENGA